MPHLLFKVSFGDEQKDVSVLHDRYGTHRYLVCIDNFLAGYFYLQDNQWQASLPPKSNITTDDIQILGGIIEENNLIFQVG